MEILISKRNPEEYPLTLTVKDISEITGLSITYAYRLLRIEGFPSFRPFGQKYLIPRDAFFRWFQDKASSIDSEN